jgi:hypothetical protein
MFMRALLVLPVLFFGTLTACQPWQAHAPEHPPPHRGVETGAGASGSAGSGTASGAGSSYGAGTAGITRRQEMCALSQRIMSAPTPEERQALLEQAMPDVPQSVREGQLDIMRQGCE